MNAKRCHPHDILLLCSKWGDPEHFPRDPAVTGWDWRNYYERRLEQTIALWVEKSMLAWQFGTQNVAAFAPVAHLVGTSREDIDYLESLSRICKELYLETDLNYRPSPDPGGPSTGEVPLGVCMQNAVPVAFKLLVQRSTDHMDHVDEYFRALYDMLKLIQEIQPFNAEEPLCNAWELLFKCDHAAMLSPTQTRTLKHELILALYPCAHAGVKHAKVAALIEEMHRQPDVLGATGRADLNAAYAMIFGPAGEQRATDEPEFDAIPVASNPAMLSSAWKDHIAVRQDSHHER
jgi:hypothetical protein